MSNQVYANSMEISCKAGSGKTICATPDVCFTPPQTPATPPGVPIPYPNTGMSSDCSDGSSSVTISGQEIMLKNKSFFKQSSGDEAGSAPKKGVITSKIQGKVYFKAWSMDVSIEGENVDRHLDLTTHNHASETGQTPPTPTQDAQAPTPKVDCEKVLQQHPVKSHKEQQADCDGLNAGKAAAKGSKLEPSEAFQSHHVISNAHFCVDRTKTVAKVCPGYSIDQAPCIAMLGNTDVSTPHGAVSRMQKACAVEDRANYAATPSVSPTYADARGDAKNQLTAPAPGPGMSDEEAECILKEVDRQFKDMCAKGMSDPSKFQLRTPGVSGEGAPKLPGLGGQPGPV